MGHNGRVQARCGAQRSNVACNPVLGAAMNLMTPPWPCITLAIGNTCIAFIFSARYVFQIAQAK